MKGYKLAAAIIVFALALLVIWLLSMSDEEAIDIAKRFYQKTGVRVTSEPSIASNILTEAVTGRKEVMVDEKREFTTTIDTKAEEVAYFTLLQWKKPKAEPDKEKQVALPEPRAKEVILALASRIGIPADFELESIKLDKMDGLWIGIWKRKYRGYPFGVSGTGLDNLIPRGILSACQGNLAYTRLAPSTM